MFQSNFVFAVNHCIIFVKHYSHLLSDITMLIIYMHYWNMYECTESQDSAPHLIEMFARPLCVQVSFRLLLGNPNTNSLKRIKQICERHAPCAISSGAMRHRRQRLPPTSWDCNRIYVGMYKCFLRISLRRDEATLLHLSSSLRCVGHWTCYFQRRHNRTHIHTRNVC